MFELIVNIYSLYNPTISIYMAVLFLYLEKSDASVRYSKLAYTGQVTFYKVPETHGHVYLVTLYVYTLYR